MIIEGTGLGHLSVNEIDKHTKENTEILKEIKNIAKKIPVVMVSQCIFGKVDMNVYDSGRKLLESGLLGNYLDITFEVAFIKLAWLLSNYKKEDIKELFHKNLIGEITERPTYKEEFI